jgi:hypothetical protein
MSVPDMKRFMRWIPILLYYIFISACYDPSLMLTAQQKDPPHLSYRIAWPWDPEITYAEGDYVTRPQNLPGGPIYKSLQGDNLGICPPSLVVGLDPPQEIDGQTPSTPGWEDWWKLVDKRQQGVVK